MVCDLSLEDPEMEHFAQDEDDLDLNKLLNHADTFSESSLEDPSEEYPTSTLVLSTIIYRAIRKR